MPGWWTGSPVRPAPWAWGNESPPQAAGGGGGSSGWASSLQGWPKSKATRYNDKKSRDVQDMLKAIQLETGQSLDVRDPMPQQWQ
eukprot:3108201-Lingulodinium_polyedra.AAC.1